MHFTRLYLLTDFIYYYYHHHYFVMIQPLYTFVINKNHAYDCDKPGARFICTMGSTGSMGCKRNVELIARMLNFDLWGRMHSTLLGGDISVDYIH